MNFYKQGQIAALEKLGAPGAGLLGRITGAARSGATGVANAVKETGGEFKGIWDRIGGGQGLKYSLGGGGVRGGLEGAGKMWQNLSPEQRVLLGQAGIGAVGGGIMGGAEGGVGGAALGALGGAGATALGGRAIANRLARSARSARSAAKVAV